MGSPGSATASVACECGHLGRKSWRQGAGAIDRTIMRDIRGASATSRGPAIRAAFRGIALSAFGLLALAPGVLATEPGDLVTEPAIVEAAAPTQDLAVSPALTGIDAITLLPTAAELPDPAEIEAPSVPEPVTAPEPEPSTAAVTVPIESPPDLSGPATGEAVGGGTAEPSPAADSLSTTIDPPSAGTDVAAAEETLVEAAEDTLVATADDATAGTEAEGAPVGPSDEPSDDPAPGLSAPAVDPLSAVMASEDVSAAEPSEASPAEADEDPEVRIEDDTTQEPVTRTENTSGATASAEAAPIRADSARAEGAGPGRRARDSIARSASAAIRSYLRAALRDIATLANQASAAGPGGSRATFSEDALLAGRVDVWLPAGILVRIFGFLPVAGGVLAPPAPWAPDPRDRTPNSTTILGGPTDVPSHRFEAIPDGGASAPSELDQPPLTSVPEEAVAPGDLPMADLSGDPAAVAAIPAPGPVDAMPTPVTPATSSTPSPLATHRATFAATRNAPTRSNPSSVAAPSVAAPSVAAPRIGDSPSAAKGDGKPVAHAPVSTVVGPITSDFTELLTAPSGRDASGVAPSAPLDPPVPAPAPAMPAPVPSRGSGGSGDGHGTLFLALLGGSLLVLRASSVRLHLAATKWHLVNFLEPLPRPG